MHQPDPTAEINARKMAHSAVFPRRGSGTGGSSNALTAAGSGIGTSNAVSTDDYPPPLLIQPPPPVAASSSGAQQHPSIPPQSLNLLAQPQHQPQPLSQSGAQMKKKSGFQITSVTSAQISASMSSNNSIAEDTESYDDLDESHTEDLSSSEILDVSLSRATDLGEPGRSSSEETLNNFQEVETPGAVSPNLPRLPQHHLPAHSQQNVMINGNVHSHHHHGHLHPSHAASVCAGLSPGPVSGKLSVSGNSDNVVLPVPVTSISSSGTCASLLPNIRSASTTGSIGVSSGTNTLKNVNIISMSGGNAKGATSMLVSNITSTVNVNAVSGATGNVNMTMLSSTGNGTSAVSSIPSNAANASLGTASGSVASQPQLPLAGASRFRVVKLDSSSEPFKKGRWTCTEYYERENAAAVAEGVAINKTVESIKQNPLDMSSERESTSGSSVSSTVSTLSHYTESVGSGEMGASCVMQQQAFQGLGPPQIDFGSAGLQSIPSSGLPQSVSQAQLAQLQLQPQEISYSQQKQVQHTVQTSINIAAGVPCAPVNIINVPSSLGHQQPSVSTMAPQQLQYSQQTSSVQTLPGVPQQQVKYAQQQQTPTSQMTSVHLMPVNQSSAAGSMQEYMQHPPKLQTSIPSVQPGVTGVGAVAPVPLVQAQSLQLQIQSTAVQAQSSVAASQPTVHTQATMPSVSAGGQLLSLSQQGNIPPVVQQQSVVNQATTSVIQQNAPMASSQVLQPPQPAIIQQGMQVSVSGLPPQVIMAPPTPLLPLQTQTQAMESVVQGIPSQQIPAVSPIPPVATAPTVNQVCSNVPPGIPSAPTVLGSLSTAQSSAGQNVNLVQSVSQPPIIATSLSVAHNVPQQIPLSSAHFPVMSLSQSMATRIEEARSFMEHSVSGLPQVAAGDRGVGASATLDGSSSSILAPGSLLPLKALPLSTPLVDGEDESSSGASVVAIDNKIEQAMDLVKSHLMYAVREEVEVLKEQIKELIEKNSQLEQENSLLKTLASPEQLAQFQAQLQTSSPPAATQTPGAAQPPAQPVSQSSGSTT
ncbi:TSC22 domain family protein 1 isoform X1 [Microcaecilia unicolor]|uniref:TSC22 domain family protein 1 n=2 Tax=Microcaecilia unicolor TaxID=1415580 RepID=A0A6P7Y059_9AMPH|nr:TSC22 domain family protein 1 isoform X1 [Microcaecilia unicolor]